MNLMDMLTGGGDPNKKGGLLGFVGALPGLLTPGSEGPTPVQGEDSLSPADLANARSMYKKQFRGAQARAVAGGMNQAGVSAQASDQAQSEYGNTVKNAMAMAAQIKASRDETARRAQMDELIKSGGYSPKQQAVLAALPDDQQAAAVKENAFAKDGDFFSTVVMGHGKALVTDKRDGSTKTITMPESASDLPVGTKVHFDSANNRVIYATPNGNVSTRQLPEPKVPGGQEGLELQAESIINSGKLIGRVPQGQLLSTLAFAQKYAKEHYGMDPGDVVLHSQDVHSITSALSMSKRQTAAMTTNLGSMENNLKTAVKYADGVGTNLPVNQILNWSARDIKADPTGKRNQLQLAVRTVVGDWAKIIAGATGAAGSTDTAQKDAAEDFGHGKYSALTLRQLQEVVRADAKGKIASATDVQNGLLQSMRARNAKGNESPDDADEAITDDGWGTATVVSQ